LAAKFHFCGEDNTMVAVHQGMKDQTDTNIARDGAAKKTQTKFATKEGMRSRIGEVTGVSGHGPDGAPDAGAPNPLDPSPTDKVLGKGPIKSSWDMKDANGQSVNGNLGKKVLTEAANLGR
jgi:hypothetical protein